MVLLTIKWSDHNKIIKEEVANEKRRVPDQGKF